MQPLEEMDASGRRPYRLLRRSSSLLICERIASIAAREPRIQPITIPISSTAGMKMKCPAVIDRYREPSVRLASRSSVSTRPRRRHSENT